MLNSTPEYVAAHQRDLAAMAPEKGSTEALAARRASRRGRLRTALVRISAIPRWIIERMKLRGRKPAAERR